MYFLRLQESSFAIRGGERDVSFDKIQCDQKSKEFQYVILALHVSADSRNAVLFCIREHLRFSISVIPGRSQQRRNFDPCGNNDRKRSVAEA